MMLGRQVLPPLPQGWWMLSSDTRTIHIWPCCHILLPVQVLSHNIHHTQPKQSFLNFLWKIRFLMDSIQLGLKWWCGRFFFFLKFQT